MPAIVESIKYWHMAIIRAVLYMLVVGGTTFLSQTETYSDSSWHELGTFIQCRIAIVCAVAAIGTLVAFLDNTMTSMKVERGQILEARFEDPAPPQRVAISTTTPLPPVTDVQKPSNGPA